MSSAVTPDLSQLELDSGFVVATGIECSAPTIRGGYRQDLLRKTGHWERYLEDFTLIAEFGIRYLRYGIPIHVVAHDPDRFDWDWTDLALDALRTSALEPIVDLLHFGVPDGLTGFGDPHLPDIYARYARAFVERYPWVRYYTPVNEPLVTAVLSADAGFWNERAKSPRALAAAIHNVATCAVLGSEIIRAARPDAVFIQSDACEGYRAAEPGAEGLAAFLNERRFVTFDLTYGRRPSPDVVAWLVSNGFPEERFDWFEEHGSKDGAILGHDYYQGNEWFVRADGTTYKARSQRRRYSVLAKEYFERYRMPFMLTETNISGHLARPWLAEVWNDSLALRDEGLPIRGFCWYGFVDHVDWDSALRWNRGKPNRCGLVDLDRRAHLVGEDYRRIAQAASRGVLDRIERAPARRRVLTRAA